MLFSTSSRKLTFMTFLLSLWMVSSRTRRGRGGGSGTTRRHQNASGRGRSNPVMRHAESSRDRKPAGTGNSAKNNHDADSTANIADTNKPKPFLIRGRSSIYAPTPQVLDEADCPTNPADDYADIKAGQHTDIGNVWIATEEENGKTCIHIDFDNYLVRDIHVYYKCDPPTKSSPGQFPYHFNSDTYIGGNGVESWCFDTLSCTNDDSEQKGYIAFHGGQAVPSITTINNEIVDAFLSEYHDTVQAVTWDPEQLNAFWRIELNNGDLDPFVYPGWCADSNQPGIYNEFNRDNFDLLSLTNPALVELNNNATESNAIHDLSKINQISWVLNHITSNVTTVGDLDQYCGNLWDGTPNLPSEFVIDWRVIQDLIWMLVEPDGNPYLCKRNHPQKDTCLDVANAIHDCADQHDTYVIDSCDDSVSAMLIYYNNDMEMSYQEIIIEIPLEDIPDACTEGPASGGSDTAWAILGTTIDSGSANWGKSYCKVV